ncbi:MAG TPA: DUF5522 domain-containing protein [Pyrinomonadaceae bacterium]|nr:DUF5522 domain-containing protein [Pyrinomonadaceae bacterium]
MIKDSDPAGADSPDKAPAAKGPEVPLVEGEDFYVENGLYVFTAKFLLRRGYCCGSGCRHCPYPKESNNQ